ncbi:hypothetical protein KGF56_004108 [Candida oxycetoniae]|uniref:DnaJ homologue subfamily C member 28 conserved domain-containing protein n=1 Tax=Candida oxycetoniae TaxID=497107 RepID=A0AAI9SUF8_9ASCO|nr:uncharacterized protein KGF56_004108 [Candida oxycetoniae]KAI3403048.2 hypothetical protein KGF56_004108 [Candida oxycetoniae]
MFALESFRIYRYSRLCWCCRRCKTSNTRGKEFSSQNQSIPVEDVNSAIVERMKLILEEKIQSQSATSTKLLSKADPSVQAILTKYDYGSYNDNQMDFEQAQAYIKNEPLLSTNKHARDIYNSKPWHGKESTYDANLRMIIDSVPKPVNDPMSTFKAKRRVVTANDRLSLAKDMSLDYKVNKRGKEEARFRELYKERLLGPSMLLNNSGLVASSIDAVGSIASNKINASINQQTGKFDDPEMSAVRGMPLTTSHLKNCTDTNYFMNQILKKQEVLPPWIEAQQSLNKAVASFRQNLDEMWFKWILNDSVMSNPINQATTINEILTFYEKNITKITYSNENKLPNVDLKFIESKIKLINSQVRHYNLQCPSASGHKLKLNGDKEIKESYWRTLEQFPSLVEKWYLVHKAKGKSKLVDNSNNNGHVSAMFKDLTFKSGAPEIHVNKDIDTRLHLWQAIKDIFKR